MINVSQSKKDWRTILLLNKGNVLKYGPNTQGAGGGTLICRRGDRGILLGGFLHRIRSGALFQISTPEFAQGSIKDFHNKNICLSHSAARYIMIFEN